MGDLMAPLVGCGGKAVNEKKSWFLRGGSGMVDVVICVSRGRNFVGFVWCWDGHCVWQSLADMRFE